MKIKRILVGRSWGSLTEQQKQTLLSIASVTDGVTADKIHFARSTQKQNQIQECIIDFVGTIYSVPGRILRTENEIEIEIEDDARIYSSMA